MREILLICGCMAVSYFGAFCFHGFREVQDDMRETQAAHAAAAAPFMR